jgi:hypothetical protein
VELKAEWPNHEEAAWRLGGHANAAGGEPILWVIGLGPDGKVTPAKHEELANWWQQVIKHFDDGVVPSMLKDAVVTLDGGDVVAMLFDTEAAPFVIKGGRDNTRVPFREGLRVDGIRRRHLVRLLTPTIHVRIPGGPDHPFRLDPITRFGQTRSPAPEDPIARFGRPDR